MNPILAAFTVDQAAKLTGLPEARIRRWDHEGLISPSLGWSNRRRPLARIYTFADLVALRTIARLKERGVSTHQLKKVKAFLAQVTDDPWGRRFWVNRETGEVFFDYEDATVAAKPMGQYAMVELIDLGPIAQDIKARIDRLSEREDERGQIVEDHFIHGGRPIFAGTRITLAAVQEIIGEGADDAEILLEFPRLTLEDIQAAKERMPA